MGKSSLLQVSDDVMEDSNDSPTIELIVSDFGEPGEPQEKHHHHKHHEEQDSQSTMTIDGTKVSI
jgi:hypothetical protein